MRGVESGFRIRLRGRSRVSCSGRSRRRSRPPGPPGRRGVPLRVPTPARPRARACSARTRCTEHRIETLRPGDSCSWRERVSVPSRSSRCEAARSRGSVEERPVHTGKVAGSIPAGTTLFRIPPTTSSVGFTSSPRTAASIGQCPLHHRSSVFPARFVRSGRSCCFVSILVPVRPFTPVSFTACRPAPRREISQ